jgi:VWFA-related protein
MYVSQPWVRTFAARFLFRADGVYYDSSRTGKFSGEAMRQTMKRTTAAALVAMFITCTLAVPALMGQDGEEAARSETTPSDKKDKKDKKEQVRPVTIQVTPHVRGSKPQQPPSETEDFIPLGEITVREDGVERKILSTRGIGNTPLALGILIQDDVVPSINNEIKVIGEFIRTLPKGSRVLVGYIRNGSLQVRQKFTTELDKAVRALRVPIGSASVAPFNPYVEIIEGLKRYESLPSGRRAMLVISDGLDTSHGISSSSAGMSMDLQRAIREAQRRSVAIYSFYAPTVTATAGRNQVLINNAQSSLQRLSDETGGRAFFQGTGAPVSFDPFLRELGESLLAQLAVTFLSTNSDKSFHRLEVAFGRTDVKADYPAGYVR